MEKAVFSRGTGMLNRFIPSKNEEKTPVTIGIEYKSKDVQIERAGKTEKVKVKVWDTAGQERYRAITGV